MAKLVNINSHWINPDHISLITDEYPAHQSDVVICVVGCTTPIFTYGDIREMVEEVNAGRGYQAYKDEEQELTIKEK